MLFIFQKGTLLVIHQGAVILANSNIVIAVIVIMLNKYNDNSDSRGDASSPNDCMEESQCVEKKIILKLLIRKNKILKMKGIKK